MAAAFKLKVKFRDRVHHYHYQLNASQGNEAFKGGDYAGAIGAYTSAIMKDPRDATFPLNRAAAYLKLDK